MSEDIKNIKLLEGGLDFRVIPSTYKDEPWWTATVVSESGTAASYARTPSRAMALALRNLSDAFLNGTLTIPPWDSVARWRIEDGA